MVRRKRSKESAGKSPKTSDSAAPDPQTPALSRRKVWTFRIAAMVLAPVLMLLILELGLTLAGFGYRCDFLIEGPEGPITNQRFGWQYFPPGIARVPMPQVLRDRNEQGAENDRRRVRIFVVGGSAALGTPESSLGFGRILERMLQVRHPQSQIEVLNGAMTAVNSHVALQVARDCAKHDPDLFIVYCGNNEVVGPYGAGTIFADYSPSLTGIRAGIAVRKTRVGQALRKLLELNAEPPAREWKGPALFSENLIPANSDVLQGVYSHFRENLRDICRAARGADSRVVLMTVVTNLRDCPPFASVHGSNLTTDQRARWEQLYEKGVADLSAGRSGQAHEAFVQAGEIDAGFAEMRYLHARALWKLGRFEEAGAEFVAARDLDALRLRADSRINRIVRDVAAEQEEAGVLLVDAVEAFRQEDQTPHGVAGNEWVHEHVHLNFAGNYLLARRALGSVEKALWGEVPDGDVPTLEECAELLAYTGWHRLQIAQSVLSLTDRPPFTAQREHAERMAALRESIERLTREHGTPEGLAESRGRIESVLERFPRDLVLRQRYVSLLSDMQDYEAAAEQCRKAIAVLPNVSSLQGNLGWYLHKLGRSQEARERYDVALQLNPYDPDIHYSYGLVLFADNNVDRALRRLDEALELNPDHFGARRVRGLGYVRLERRSEAIEELRKALEIRPEEVAVRIELALEYLKAEKFEEARAQYEQILARKPDFVQGLTNLGLIHLKAGRAAEAARCFRRWVRLAPNSAKARALLREAERATDSGPFR